MELFYKAFKIYIAELDISSRVPKMSSMTHWIYPSWLQRYWYQLKSDQFLIKLLEALAPLFFIIKNLNFE